MCFSVYVHQLVENKENLCSYRRTGNIFKRKLSVVRMLYTSKNIFLNNNKYNNSPCTQVYN